MATEESESEPVTKRYKLDVRQLLRIKKFFMPVYDQGIYKGKRCFAGASHLSSEKEFIKRGDIVLNKEQIVQLLKDTGIADTGIIICPGGIYHCEPIENGTAGDITTRRGKKFRPKTSDILISEEDYGKLVQHIDALIEISKQGIGGRV